MNSFDAVRILLTTPSRHLVARDGGRWRARVTVHASGRAPDVRADGDLVFHSDDHTVSRKPTAGVIPLRGGANAVWW